MRDNIIAIVCPDIHGRTFWKSVAKEYDGSVPFIFLGDYLDPYPDENITPEKAKENFIEIWNFKEQWGDKVIMLLGNHDLSYFDRSFRCCRFSSLNSVWYNTFLKENWEYFKIAHNITNGDKTFIMSHAGIHPLWLHKNGFESIFDADYINSLFSSKMKPYNDFSYYRGGYEDIGSPIWADIREFVNTDEKLFPENIMQIVGHTQLSKDKIELKNICCIDSRQPFVITKNNEINVY
jgi:hypothetical protein